MALQREQKRNESWWHRQTHADAGGVGSDDNIHCGDKTRLESDREDTPGREKEFPLNFWRTIGNFNEVLF